MAKRVISQVVFEDDLTGEAVEEDALQTLRFTVEGVQYEIDLNPENADSFRTAMEPYITAARRIGGKRGGATKKAASANGTSNGSSNGTSNGKTNGEHSAAEIRAWARTENIELSERGRIPEEIRDRFVQAKAATAAL